MNELNFFKKDYSERQFVEFIDDEDYSKLGSERSNFDWLKDNILDLGLVAVNPIAGASYQMYKFFRNSETSGIKINPVPKSLKNKFVFPVNETCDVYVGHPKNERQYFPLKDFHKFILEHKFSELINILLHLGAIDISVEYKEGWGQELSAAMSAVISETGDTLNGTAGSKSTKNNTILFNMQLEGTDSPSLAENLSWYPFEETWKLLVNARLKFGLKDTSLKFTYNQDFGINANLITNLENNNINIGGNFTKHNSTVWDITVKFK